MRANLHLYRPTGLEELLLVLRRDLGGWPPRLPEQPIFYPVLNQAYAAQIARDWNTRSGTFAGYVTAFELDDEHASRFERKVVGGRQHEELWVPAEDLEDFNRHIVGPIRVVDAFFGEEFVGLIPETGALRGQGARDQLHTFARLYAEIGPLRAEVSANREAIFLHYPFWQKLPEPPGLVATRAEVLSAVRSTWSEAFPALPLPETIT